MTCLYLFIFSFHWIEDSAHPFYKPHFIMRPISCHSGVLGVTCSWIPLEIWHGLLLNLSVWLHLLRLPACAFASSWCLYFYCMMKTLIPWHSFHSCVWIKLHAPQSNTRLRLITRVLPKGTGSDCLRVSVSWRDLGILATWLPLK